MSYFKNISSTNLTSVGNPLPLKSNILPERYNSISKISPHPIVSPELNSQTRIIHLEITENLPVGDSEKVETR